MTPEQRAAAFAELLETESGIPSWRREMIRYWVLNAIREAVAAERERIAVLADEVGAAYLEQPDESSPKTYIEDFGDLIREGGAG